MKKKIVFVTLGDISSIATMKRALGMANPLNSLGWEVSIIAMDCPENRKRIGLECNENTNVYYFKECSVREEIEYKTGVVKKIAPDYVYFCSLSARNWVRKSKLGCKPEMIIEHSELFSSIEGLGIKLKLKAKVMEYGSVLYADRIIGASTYLTKVYRKYAKMLFRTNLPILYSPYAYNNDVINAPKVILEKLRL